MSYQFLCRREGAYFGSDACQMEIDFAGLAAQITENGFTLNVAGAQALSQALDEQEQLQATRLQEMLPPKRVETIFIPKRDNQRKGYVKGQPYIKISYAPFNPNSPAQIIERVFEANGFVPRVLTESGNPSTKAEVLGSLPYPEAQLISALKVCGKIQTMLTGPKGWLNVVTEDGKIRTSYNTLGTVTGRCSHSPNIAQVPKVRKDSDKQVLRGAAGRWGWDCRALFSGPAGWYLVGIDMAGLELRMLAHYLARWDDGEYALVVTEQDPHVVNAAAIGGNVTREQSKTFIYAMIYSGGEYKLGTIIEPDLDDEFSVRWIGQTAKEQLISNITGFKELFRWLDSMMGDYIQGLDGRMLFVRKKFARLNTLLQGGGSIVCKRWALLTEARLQALGLHHGDDYQICAFVHDELCIAARTPEIAQIVADVGVAMCRQAGHYYDLQCPLDGEAKIGRTWAETH